MPTDYEEMLKWIIRISGGVTFVASVLAVSLRLFNAYQEDYKLTWKEVASVLV